MKQKQNVVLMYRKEDKKEKYVPQTTEEKALFYLNLNTYIFYGYCGLSAFLVVGILGFVMIILERHFSFKHLLSLLCIVAGFIIAFIDVNIRVLIAAKKPKIYERAYEWEKTAYPLRFGDKSLKHDRIKFFSLKGIRLGMENSFTMIIYESYKWIFLFLLFMFALSISIPKGGALFNVGLAMVSWGRSYLILWQKKYFWRAAKTLGVTEERGKEIKEFFKKGVVRVS